MSGTQPPVPVPSDPAAQPVKFLRIHVKKPHTIEKKSADPEATVLTQLLKLPGFSRDRMAIGANRLFWWLFCMHGLGFFFKFYSHIADGKMGPSAEKRAAASWR